MPAPSGTLLEPVHRLAPQHLKVSLVPVLLPLLVIPVQNTSIFIMLPDYLALLMLLAGIAAADRVDLPLLLLLPTVLVNFG